MLKKILSYSPHIFALLFVLAFAAFAWTEPPYGGVCSDPPCPPGGNVPVPLNVGSTGQSKVGGLILGTNCVGTCVNGLIVDKGNVGIGETNPSEKLDVAGNIDLNSNAIKNVGSVNFNDGTSQSTAADTLGVFGDGSDGNITISSAAQLSRDMYYNNLTVNAGVELKTNGFRIHVKNTATINGTISNNGGDGDINLGGITPAGSLGGGGTGGICTFAGGWAQAGTPGPTLSGFGGNGGTGYLVNGGIVTPPSSQAGGFRVLPSIYFLRDFEGGRKIQGGAGGGSGYFNPTYCGGGGGGGGGVIFLSSRNLILNGTVRANGGSGSFASYPPGTGRGGGGGGGLAVVIYNFKSGSGSIQVNGGAGAQSGFPGQTIEIDLP